MSTIFSRQLFISLVNVDQRLIISSLVVFAITLLSLSIVSSELQLSWTPEASFSMRLLIIEKYFSIGANSGAYAGRNITRNPSFIYCFFIDFDLCIDALSNISSTLPIGNLIFVVTNSLRFLINMLKISELIDSFTNQEIMDPSDAIAEIIEIELEKQMLFMVSSSPFWIHEYSFFINLENDDSSTLIKHWEVFIASKSWIQNIDLMYVCFSKSNLMGLDFPFL